MTRSVAVASESKKILIVTSKLDPHTDVVIDELSKNGASVFRLNSEALLNDYSFSFRYDNDCIEGEIVDSLGRCFSMNEISSAYYRKPLAVLPHVDVINEDAVEFSRREGGEFLKAIYEHPGLTWVNSPRAIERAERKPPQLRVAADVGLKVPRTLITNEPEAAREFCKQCNNDVVCKTLLTMRIQRDRDELKFYTRRLSGLEINRYIETVAYAPTLIQEYIPKTYEIRVTVIGDKVFACKIDSQDVPEAATDWRRVDASRIPHWPYELPDDINSALRNFLRHYGLSFGAIDLIKTPNSEYVFLENNPNGQWYWIEILTGMPLASAMAELLML